MKARAVFKTLLLSVMFIAAVSIGNAQTAIYHLHKDASNTTSGANQLLTAGPNATTGAVSSQNLKNLTGEFIVKAFDTQTGTPNMAGVIAANSTITFSVWMKKSSTSGVIYPRVKLFLNSTGGALLGSVTGGTALTSTLTQYTFNVNTGSAVTMTTTDRFYLWVGVNVATAPTTNTDGVLNVEGTLNGNYDSQITVPLPNAPPTVSLTSPQNGTTYSNPVSILLSATAADSDGSVTKVEFFEGANKLGEVTSSPYNFTWNNPPPASSAYVLTAKATDNTNLTTTSSTVSVTVAGNGNLFHNSSIPSSVTPVDISAEGTSDWVHWGLNSATSLDRKNVTAQISYLKIGTGSQFRLTDATFNQQWTGGTPTATSAGTRTGIFTQTSSNGFQLTVPADTTPQILRLYVGLWAAAGRMEATLSDGSAPAVLDTSFSNAANVSHALFTINFKAASAGQTLTVKYTLNGTYISGGNVTLDSVTLFPASSGGSGSLTGSFANPASSINLTTEGTSDWAHWGFGSNSTFDHKSGVLSEISGITKIGNQGLFILTDNPTSFSWTGGTPSSSATNTQTGLFTAGIGNGFQFNVPADTEEKILRVYTGLWRAQGRLEATLSDGSAAPFINTSLSNATGTSNGVYTITFKAASPGQSLRIRYTNVSNDPAGNVTLEAATLQYTAPAITSLSSNSGPAGGSITITGSNFGVTQGNSTISFNGVNGTPTSWNSTTIVVPVPAAASSGPIVATVRGVASNSMSFTVTPGIASLSATSGVIGGSTTITGSAFGPTQGTSTVTFNGVAATPTSWANTSITVPVPTGATTGNVVVTVGGLASNGVAFSVKPNIQTINPAAAGIGDSVAINGTSFGATQETSSVTFNGTAATPTNWSDTSIVVPVPAGSTSGSVVVTVNGLASSGFSFGVAPKITSISPNVAPTGQSVTISGTSFGASQGTSTVSFNGTAATPSSWSATSITVPVPSGASSGNVVVTVAGLASSGFGFTVASHITTVNPTSGAVGDSVTVTGTDFGATQGTSTITFNGTAATPTSWSNTSITVPVPAGATTGSIVTNVGGVSSNSVSFTVKPKITAIDPGSGAAGEPVTITGTTFGATQGSNTVTFNGVAASPTSWSDSSISVPVPTTATSGPVVITASGSASNGFTFNVTTTVSLSGKVTVAGSTTPIPGATVKALQGNTVVATQTTNGVGDYTFASLVVGMYTVEASASGYGTKRKALVSVVSDPSTANLALDAIVSGPVRYNYDSVGRLVSTVGPADTIIYTYDATGNLLSISRQSSSDVAVLNFTPTSGSAGTTVTINGSGFSATAGQNTVQFNGTNTSVTSATTTKLVVTVPAGATTGTISVTSPAGSDTSDGVFTIGGPGQPTITSFSPGAAAPGEPVTITGTNFSTAIGDNKVKFSSGRATVTSANATTIGANVPFAHSGKVTVSTPFGDAVSTADFFIPPAGYVGSDVENTGRMSIGGSHTMSVTTAGKIAMVIFDGVAGQRISIMLGPVTANDCKMKFLRPDYSNLRDEGSFVPWGGNQWFIEPFTLPVTGTYTILMDPNTTTTGNVPITIYDVPPDITDSISIGGSTQTWANTAPGQNVILSFTGTQGQVISLRGTGATVDGSITIKKPDGNTLAFSQGGFFNGFIDQQTLPVSGTYTILLDFYTQAVGSINITLYDAADLTSPIEVDGAQINLTTTVPGQNARFTFEGTTGQRIFINLPTAGNSYALKRPDGTVVASMPGGTYIDPPALDATGTFTILGDPQGTNTGTLSARIYSVPADLTGSITVNAAPIPIAIQNIGQNYELTFEVASSQQVTVHVTGSTYQCVGVYLMNSSGTVLTQAGPCFTNFNLSPYTLPSAGTYKIKVDPSGPHTGTLNLSVTNP